MFILTNYYYALNSERAAKTGAEGTRLEEGGKINRSLMHLGTVIRGKHFCMCTIAPVLKGLFWDNCKLAALDRYPLTPGFKLMKKNTDYFHFGSIARISK